MKKPFHQRTYETIRDLGIGAGILAIILGAVNDAADIFHNLAITTCATVIFILLAVLLYFSVKYRKPNWKSLSGPLVPIVKLGKRIYLGIAGMLILVWIGLIWNIYKTTAPQQPALSVQTEFPVKANYSTPPIFAAVDKRFRILIFSWDQQGSYNNKTYSIGPLLKEQFDELCKREHVDLVVEYLDDSLKIGKMTPEKADSLMKYHHADLILYGSYSLKECEGGGADKICFNYQTYYSSWASTTIHDKIDYEMVDFHGQHDLRRGSGHEEVNYILYWGAALADIKGKHFAKAIEKLHKIPGFESREEVLFQLGSCYYHMNDYTNARISNEKALKLNPMFTEATVHVGVTLACEHKYEAAKKCFETVLKNEPENLEALRNLGRLQKAMGDTLAAISCFDKILQSTTPVSESDWALAGMTYQDVGNHARAARCYEKSLQIHASHPDRWTNLAIVYKDLKDTSRAEGTLRHALAIDSTYSPAWYQLGMLSYYKKEKNRAQLYLEKAVRFNAANNEAWAMLGLNSYFLAQPEKAKRYLERAYAINPNAYSTLYWSFFVYKDLKEYPKAKHFLNALLKLRPDEAQLWNELGVINGHLDNYEEAITCFKRTLQGLPDNGVVYYNLASISSCQHNKKVALNYLSRAIALEPSVKQIVKKDKSFDWLRSTQEFLAILR